MISCKVLYCLVKITAQEEGVQNDSIGRCWILLFPHTQWIYNYIWSNFLSRGPENWMNSFFSKGQKERIEMNRKSRKMAMPRGKITYPSCGNPQWEGSQSYSYYPQWVRDLSSTLDIPTLTLSIGERVQKAPSFENQWEICIRNYRTIANVKLALKGLICKLNWLKSLLKNTRLKTNRLSVKRTHLLMLKHLAERQEQVDFLPGV